MIEELLNAKFRRKDSKNQTNDQTIFHSQEILRNADDIYVY